jgi:hypothetical protein
VQSRRLERPPAAEGEKNKKKYQQNLHMQNNLQLVEHFNKNRPAFFSSFFFLF